MAKTSRAGPSEYRSTRPPATVPVRARACARGACRRSPARLRRRNSARGAMRRPASAAAGGHSYDPAQVSARVAWPESLAGGNELLKSEAAAVEGARPELGLELRD